MKKALFLCIILSCVLLSACGPTDPATPQVDYQSTITAYAVQNTTLNLNAQDLTKENENLKVQLTELQTEINALEEEIKENENLKVQLTELQTEINALEEEIKTYQGLMYGTEEHYIPQVLCLDATKVEFSYADIDSMVEELKQYIAEVYGVDEDQVTAEYFQIWSDFNDMIVETRDGKYMRPYFVTFVKEGYEIFNTVYNLTLQCYVDFPKLEEKLSEVSGN